MTPMLYDSAYNGEIYRPYRRRAPAAPVADAAVASGTCSGFAPGVNELPIQELEKVVDGDEEQRAALNDVKAATRQGLGDPEAVLLLGDAAHSGLKARRHAAAPAGDGGGERSGERAA